MTPFKNKHVTSKTKIYILLKKELTHEKKNINNKQQQRNEIFEQYKIVTWSTLKVIY